MKHTTLAVAVISAISMASYAARAETIESAYTELNVERDCSVFDINQEGGEFANFACNGYLGYPVIIYSGDLRESVFYGYPPQTEHQFETFAAFNSSGPKIEWRVAVDGAKRIPFATIHRWFVSDNPDAPETKTEVLVVEKVGQIDKREGCAVGFVVATGNPKANDTARKIADEQVRTFACGADEPVQVEGTVGVPAHSRD